jgi:hypothetical protein
MTEAIQTKAFARLSKAQVETLDQLARDWPFGTDARSVRGLRRRGLVVDRYWNPTFPAMPGLADGVAEAWFGIQTKAGEG